MAQALHYPALLNRLGAIARPAPQVAFALRFGAATSIAIWLGHHPALLTNDSQWILITVLMVMQPQEGGSKQKGALRLFGTLAAAATSVALFGAFAQDPPLIAAGLFVVQAIGGYGFSGQRGQYAWFVFAFTTAIVLGSAMSGSGAVETLAFQRATMVALGILIVLVLDTLIWPSRAEPALRAALAKEATALAERLRRAIDPNLREDEDRPAALASPLASHFQLLAAARTESGVSNARAAALNHIAVQLALLASRERLLRRGPHAAGLAAASETPEFRFSLRDLAEALKATLGAVAGALRSGYSAVLDTSEVESALSKVASNAAPGDLARVAALRGFEAPLLALVAALSGMDPDRNAGPPPAQKHFQVDPFRVQIAIRSGIAVCAAFILVEALGWSTNTLVAPIAFMIACTPTRGGVTQTALLLAAIVCIGWATADVGLVFVTPVVGRMPTALVFPLVVATLFAYLSVTRPKLALLRSIGGLVALLPVYSGIAAPTDVYGPYNTVCYITLALTIGVVATRLLWPATAATIFRKRGAAQIELCRRAYLDIDPDTGDAERLQRAAELIGAFAKQGAMLASLHGQAHLEAPENALDDGRRAQLLAHLQNLFDAALAASKLAAAIERRTGADVDAATATARSALVELRKVVETRLDSAAATLRSTEYTPSPDLDTILAKLEAASAAIDSASELPAASDSRPLLREIVGHRIVAERQRALEAWFSEWRAAEDRS